ncbi:MAG TPA: cytochrome c oxidase subunit 3 [Candidatus Acidoferrales bacterium]|nr:cytochrome c oxidase subunit 3 [Candidatus Acidoferrales bacterium]
MTNTVLAPPAGAAREEKPLSSGDDGNGIRGGNFGGEGPHGGSGPGQEHGATSFSAYRIAMLIGMVWSAALFVTLAFVLELRWVHSRDWHPIALPNVFFADTIVLLASSVTFELARLSLVAEAIERCARWLWVTEFLGLAFLGGQMAAWRQLASRGLHFASNPGSFLLHLILAIHGIYALGGVLAVLSALSIANRAASKRRLQTPVRAEALYWHFMDGLWLTLLLLLLATIQN